MKWFKIILLPLSLFAWLASHFIRGERNEVKKDVSKLDASIKSSILKSGFLNRTDR